jgi:P-type Cu+ transporter
VAFLDSRFCYFCDLGCRARLLRRDAPARRGREAERAPFAARSEPRLEVRPAAKAGVRLDASADASHEQRAGATPDPGADGRPEPGARPGAEPPGDGPGAGPGAAAAGGAAGEADVFPVGNVFSAQAQRAGQRGVPREGASPRPPGAARAGEAEPAAEREGDAEGEGEAGDADVLLLFTAAAAGALSVGLLLLGASPVVTGARAVVAAVGGLALAGRLLTVARDPADAHPAVLLAAPVLTSLTALGARFLHDPAAPEATSVAGVVVAVSAVLLALRRRSLADAEAERRWISAALSLPGRRIGRDDAVIVAAHELRPGEQVQVEQGELSPVDMTITRGHAVVLPWLGATARAERREGDSLVAGARLIEGMLQGVAGWAGNDRAWARLLLDPSRRVDVWTSLCRGGRLAATQGAVAAAALAALAVFANGGRLPEVILAALAAHASLATTTVATVAGMHTLRGALAAARRGVAYRSPEAWDAAARVSLAVFLARGTLLLGEPDVVEIEPSGRHDAAQVLAWVAGAEAGQAHPIATAVQRAAHDRAIAPDAVRSPHVVPGLGVKAVTSAGEVLLVGSRALMLEERVSIAMAEGRVAELEGLGRMVLLVGIGGRLAGLVALQDGLRPGARASVQHLLDVDVEPVLLSGDARETCETIARALDIDHVRPEVLPAERAGEIRRLVEGGARVAVVGRPESDAAVLGAADVSVALGAAGSSPSEWAISLVGDDVRDAALAISLAHRTRAEARTGLVLAVSPGVVGALAVAFGLLPPVFAPLAGLVGGVVATLHARAVGGLRRDPPPTPWDMVIPAPPPGPLG